MIGSDWPVCTVAGTYTEVIGIVGSYVAGLSNSDQESVFGATAIEFYGLTAG